MSHVYQRTNGHWVCVCVCNLLGLGTYGNHGLLSNGEIYFDEFHDEVVYNGLS